MRFLKPSKDSLCVPGFKKVFKKVLTKYCSSDVLFIKTTAAAVAAQTQKASLRFHAVLSFPGTQPRPVPPLGRVSGLWLVLRGGDTHRNVCTAQARLAQTRCPPQTELVKGGKGLSPSRDRRDGGHGKPPGALLSLRVQKHGHVPSCAGPTSSICLCGLSTATEKVRPTARNCRFGDSLSRDTNTPAVWGGDCTIMRYRALLGKLDGSPRVNFWNYVRLPTRIPAPVGMTGARCICWAE